MLNTHDNRVQLAYAVAESMDLETLIDCLVENLVDAYEDNDEVFQDEWEEIFGEEA